MVADHQTVLCDSVSTLAFCYSVPHDLGMSTHEKSDLLKNNVNFLSSNGFLIFRIEAIFLMTACISIFCCFVFLPIFLSCSFFPFTPSWIWWTKGIACIEYSVLKYNDCQRAKDKTQTQGEYLQKACLIKFCYPNYAKNF